MSEGNSGIEGQEQDRIRKLIDLTDGDRESFSSLKEAVEKSNGVVRVLVHPRFNPYSSLHPLTDEYIATMEGFIATSPVQHSPLVIFEEEEALEELGELIGSLEQAFLVRTIPADPLPATPTLKDVVDKDISEAEAFRLEQEAEKTLYGNLKGAGVQKIIVGGRYFFLGDGKDDNHDFKSFIADTSTSPSNKEWAELKYYPKGCVGGVVIGGMEEGIEVVVSHATSPQRLPTLSDRHAQLVATAD